MDFIYDLLEPQASEDAAGSCASSSTAVNKQAEDLTMPVAPKASVEPKIPENLVLDQEEQEMLQAALAEPVVTKKASMKKPAAAKAKAKQLPKAKAKPKGKPKAKPKAASGSRKRKFEEECKTSKRKRVKDAAYHTAKNAALSAGPGRARLKAAEAAEARARQYDALGI